MFAGGTILLEVSQYDGARVRATDALLSDQGLLNIAVGYRRRDDLVGALNHLLATTGAKASVDAPESYGAVYLTLDDGLSLEMIAVPRELDREYGFIPAPALRGDLRWPGRLEQNPA